uniref:Uncharacterized protein n=1 Tax=Steinernema glaseri TaxID=37863 RepID=A0A1I7ZUF5_9BILA
MIRVRCAAARGQARGYSKVKQRGAHPYWIALACLSDKLCQRFPGGWFEVQLSCIVMCTSLLRVGSRGAARSATVHQAAEESLLDARPRIEPTVEMSIYSLNNGADSPLPIGDIPATPESDYHTPRNFFPSVNGAGRWCACSSREVVKRERADHMEPYFRLHPYITVFMAMS